MAEIIRNALRGMFRRKTQLLLTVAGVAAGVFSVLIISAIGGAGERIIDDELAALGFDCITITPTDAACNYLNEASVETIAHNDCVAVACPLMTGVCQVSMRGYIGDALLCGVDENADRVVSMDMSAGRFLEGGEIDAASKVCVVGETLAQDFYRRSNIVGKVIEVIIDGRSEEFTVVGVIEKGQGAIESLASGYVPSFIYIPHTVFSNITGRSELDMVFVRLREGKTSEDCRDITTSLSLGSGYRNLYTYADLAAQKDSLSSIVEVVAAVLSAIGGVSLLVAGLSIMTIMVSAVTERTREIGIKKAIGARRCDIMAEFLTESAMIAFIGAAVGALLCAAVCALARLLLKIDISLNIGTAALALAAAIAVGAAFGAYPACKASALSPVEALRRE